MLEMSETCSQYNKYIFFKLVIIIIYRVDNSKINNIIIKELFQKRHIQLLKPSSDALKTIFPVRSMIKVLNKQTKYRSQIIQFHAEFTIKKVDKKILNRILIQDFTNVMSLHRNQMSQLDVANLSILLVFVRYFHNNCIEEDYYFVNAYRPKQK